MILYEKGTTDFSRNGLGFLNNVISANVVEELNGEYSLTFDYPLNETLSNELLEGGGTVHIADGSALIIESRD